MKVGTNCTISDSIYVDVQICADFEDLDETCKWIIPNLITPSRTRFQIKNDCGFESYHLSIYSKTGRLIFESEDANISWPLKKEAYPSGMYYYIIRYKTNHAGGSSLKTKSGKLVLMNGRRV